MRRLSIRSGDIGRLVWSWAVGAISLVIADIVLPNLSADSIWVWLGVALITGIVGALLRPVLVMGAAVIGWIAVFALAFLGQAVILSVALALVPAVHVGSFWTLVAAAWITAILATVLEWLSTAGTPDHLVALLARDVRPGKRSEPIADPEVTGLIMIQLDGVPFPLLRWALQSGLMPTLRRWVDSGDHVAREWTAQLPCTTPASQLGILHGTSAGVPAFRWYDRELGRILVANKPADARVIEERASTGHGLLADDGASISNLFSGDAVSCSMVMSRTGLTRGSLQTRKVLATFMARPEGFARSFGRAIAEIVRERQQARRQKVRKVVPRMTRPWEFAALRAVTNGLLRDVNITLVAREMEVGRKSIYVDFVDFDEVAHHAGAVRLESLAVLGDLDRIVDVISQLADLAPRTYEIVLVSDHGQSTGESFADRYGQGLDGLVRELIGASVHWEGAPVEGWGRAGSIVEDVAATSKPPAVAGGLARTARRRQGVSDAPEAEPVVLGSGNLGLIYSGTADRWSLEVLEEEWPGLIDGLSTHPGIGFIAGVDDAGTPFAIGGAGRQNLLTGEVQGTDPLLLFPEHSARVLATALADPRAPDLYVNSLIDPSTDEVAAFEDLVGCHGGLGGWQDRGLVVAPTYLWTSEDQVEGAGALHRELVRMLEALGHRKDLPPINAERVASVPDSSRAQEIADV